MSIEQMTAGERLAFLAGESRARAARWMHEARAASTPMQRTLYANWARGHWQLYVRTARAAVAIRCAP